MRSWPGHSLRILTPPGSGSVDLANYDFGTTPPPEVQHCRAGLIMLKTLLAPWERRGLTAESPPYVGFLLGCVCVRGAYMTLVVITAGRGGPGRPGCRGQCRQASRARGQASRRCTPVPNLASFQFRWCPLPSSCPSRAVLSLRLPGAETLYETEGLARTVRAVMLVRVASVSTCPARPALDIVHRLEWLYIVRAALTLTELSRVQCAR